MQQNVTRDGQRPPMDRNRKSGAPNGSRPRPDRERTAQARERTGGQRPARDGQGQSRPPQQRHTAAKLIFCLAALLVAWGLLISPLGPVHSAVIEAGDAVRMEMFVRDAAADTHFLTDVAALDTTRPGTYDIQLMHNGRTYDTDLIVRDTVPPVVDVSHVIVPYGETTEALACVGEVHDISRVTAVWKQPPDFNTLGEQVAVARVTDEGGNSVEVTVPLKVAYDAVPPVLSGARDISVYLGDSIAYRHGVTVTDNDDPAPTLEIDSSGVNMDAVGVYEATYTAADETGNQVTRTVTVTIQEKPEDFVEEDEVYRVAQKYYDQIIDDDMTDMQKAFAIYRWVRGYIYYVDSSDKTYWTMGAYHAFTTLQGDCFNYYAAAKALLNMAGIDNVDVVKSDTSHSRHYWLLINLGDGWYHYDACPRAGDPYEFFMLTDAELDWYSSRHENTHIFESSLYPERATKSVQGLVDYENNTVRG